ncbi:MAG TPA: hypothetical protein VM554_14680 [Acidisarcina sp.]|nr:hypothetical protein [Acidisarcina sp.]
MNAPAQTRHPLLWLLLAVFVLLLAAAVTGVLILRRHAEPILRARVIESLSARFNSKVELGEFHGEVRDGLLVQGSNLKLYPRAIAWEKPLFAIRRFSFHTSWKELLRTPMHVELVQVEGMELNLPPKDQRSKMPEITHAQEKISIYVHEMDITEAHLTLGTSNPGKLPLEFDISQLVLHTIAQGQPMKFQTTLVNPKPVGDIASSGYFGPFNADSPGDSNVRGSYEFSHADLSTIKGIGGMLSSQGQYSGTLNQITVDGSTETPDFSVSISGHPVPLQTTFHAIVDGTNGDTLLDPVDATLAHSHLIARGRIVRAEDRSGHDIHLHVIVDKARVEDLLRLGVRTDPPVMTGAAQLTTALELPSGDIPVHRKLRLHGRFSIERAHFTNPATQNKIDSLSLRGQGKPKEAAEPNPDDVFSRMKGNFTLRNDRLMLDALQYNVPGLQVNLDGVYSLDGNDFDFHGKARLDARLSHMTTGWKSLLLKPVDPFFAKDGAGTVLPVKITGTRSEPHFGLDFGH